MSFLGGFFKSNWESLHSEVDQGDGKCLKTLQFCRNFDGLDGLIH